MTYLVQWENVIEADTPLEAAKEAVTDIQNGLTLGFSVKEMKENGKHFSVDLSENDENAVLETK